MKLINLEELKKRLATGSAIRVIDEKDNAEKLQAILVTIPLGAQGPKLHYHTQRESWILVLTGEGKEIVEGQEYPLKANESIFILPNEKHTIKNTGTTELKYLEIYTLPSDFIIAE